MKVAILPTNDHCELNAHFSTRLDWYFQVNGHTIVGRAVEADLLVLTTCGFGYLTTRKTLHLIRLLRTSARADQRILVTGCLPAISDLRAHVDTRFALIPLREADAVDRMVEAKVPLREVVTSEVAPQYLDTSSSTLLSTPGGEGDRFLLVSRGCANQCQYWYIRKAASPLCSTPIELVKQRFLDDVRKGFRKFVLLSDDLGSYGLDIGSDFVTLIETLPALAPDARFALHYVYLGRLVACFGRFEPLVAAGMIERLNVPIQTVSERLLRAMNRKYRVDQVLRCVERIHQLSPHTRVLNQILIGFPTERDEDVPDTIEVSRRYFDFTHAILCIDRPGVPAHDLEPKVSPEELKRRVGLVTAYAAIEG
jgi:tRNA A37 methylthiotransferase MiaB